MDNEWTDGLTDELISFLERSLSGLDYRGEAGGENISRTSLVEVIKSVFVLKMKSSPF